MRDPITFLFDAFDEAAARKSKKTHFKAICKAIDEDNVPEIKKLFSLENIPGGMLQDFIQAHGVQIMDHALDHGKLDTFIPVYTGIGKPNLAPVEYYTVNGSAYNGPRPLLIKAIDLRKVGIAAYIAKDPAVDITQKRDGDKQTAYEVSKEIMDRGEGMESVVSILSERIALMTTQEAERNLAQVKERADKLLADAERLRSKNAGLG